MSNFGVLIAPIIASVIVLVILLIARRKGAVATNQYDERQALIRATGYKAGFLVTLFFLLAFGFLSEFSEGFARLASPGFCMIAAGLIGILVFVLYCIAKDAFYGLGQNRKGYMLLCAVIVLMTGLTTFENIRHGTLLEDGRATLAATGSLLTGMFFLVVLIALLRKELQQRNEVDE